MALIGVEVTGAAEVAQALQSRASVMRQALVDSMRRQLFKIQSQVVTGKLSGDPLHRRTGVLASSINNKLDDDGTEIAGQVGTKVRYGRVHELGGTFQIPAHARKVTSVFGRPVTAHEITVRAHSATFPQRSFLRSTLNDMRAQVIAAIRADVAKATGRG